MRPLTQHVAAHAARKHVAAALGMHTRGHKAAAAPRSAFFMYSEGALKVLRMYSELTPTVLRWYSGGTPMVMRTAAQACAPPR